MRSLTRKPSIPYGILAAAFSLVVIVFGIILAARTHAESQTPVATGEHLITLHDNGQDKGFLTDAKTLGEAFKKAGIQIDPNDLIEPGLNETLVASHYDVNVYRARPVTVVDGNTRTKILSPYQTPKQIVEHANFSLQDEDIATISANTDMVSQGAGLQVAIDRAAAFTFVMYGKTITAYTQAGTVGEMLNQKKITLGKNDALSVPKTTPITAGMTVELWRNGVQTITEEQDIAFEVEQTKDRDREVTYKEVKTPGVVGKRTVSYEVEMINGKEVSRKEIQSVVTKEPVKQIEVVGAKSRIMPYTGGGSKSEWLAASGIPEASWGAADYIVSRESGWNPNATNRSSGACGLAQALPCSKVPGNPYDPIDSLRWMNGYVIGRYGSWEAAVAFKQANGWY
jgi:uncharacterized protein YabE (DUF348 family)